MVDALRLLCEDKRPSFDRNARVNDRPPISGIIERPSR